MVHSQNNSFSNRKIEFPRNDFQSSDFSSTLLIPSQHFLIFQEKIAKHKGIRSYIAYLLVKYQLAISNGMIPGYSKVTTKYQEKGQNLHKVAFRPRPQDWAELKLYRISFGMSISAFIIYLLIADSVDFAETVSKYLESVGISSTPNLDLCSKVYLYNSKSIYTIIFQYRESRDH
ncbi:MAG TPA: DUF1564 family protein [Leptospiraceae bacterium]|nr:DUF1564 family protein [Leptospiraceae bacterium]HMW03618.1 DUF1564 family protein [Leptospiraceae bacterium]HMX31255.1 DUF1564 family protein [Leptospiraceae bacterium]HMY29461.1 DUF1564 family protein [Leptospiraceae bacterium]HMZ64748.1 DUF1564 family protein [Leptospiraceae bacterium]